MFGSEALDIATGLVLVFLLVSIMLTALSEIIEAVFKTRAADLEKAVAQMMGPPDDSPDVDKRTTQTADLVREFYSHSLVSALYPGAYTKAVKSSTLLFRRLRGNNLPSYIPRDLFSATVLDLVKDAADSTPIANVVQKLEAAVGLPGRRAALEDWYDGVMDRVAGTYKRRTQKMMFWLGLVIALLFNVNPIAITSYLREAPDARRDIVELARHVQDANATVGQPTSTGKAAPTSKSTTNATLTATSTSGATLCAPNATDLQAAEKCQEAIAGVGLPVGWTAASEHKTFPHAFDKQGKLSLNLLSLSWPNWSLVLDMLLALVGWSITGLAATLGAPFWFDTLNKVMIVRSTVKPKEKSRDEASADRSDKTVEKQAPDEAVARVPAATGPGIIQPDASDDGAVG